MTSAAGPTRAPVPGAAGPADVHLEADGNVAVPPAPPGWLGFLDQPRVHELRDALRRRPG